MIILLVYELLNFSCPRIDISLESAVREYKDKLQIIMLSGANEDGLQSTIYAKKEKSGIWVQDPETCEYPEMTSCLVRAALAERILKVDQIIDQVLKLELY